MHITSIAITSIFLFSMSLFICAEPDIVHPKNKHATNSTQPLHLPWTTYLMHHKKEAAIRGIKIAGCFFSILSACDLFFKQSRNIGDMLFFRLAAVTMAYAAGSFAYDEIKKQQILYKNAILTM